MSVHGTAPAAGRVQDAARRPWPMRRARLLLHRAGRPAGGHSRPSGSPIRLVALMIGVVMLAAACGGDEVPELTLEDRLEELEGRALTAGEVAARLNTASAICAMDDPVLDAVWRRLSEDQMAFQDFIFAHICPDRSIFYAGLTGRYVTEEAENSGVVTSTTPPIRTTTTAPSVADGATTTAPAGRPSADVAEAEEDGSESTGVTLGTSKTEPESSTTSASGAGPTTTAPDPDNG